ncbi:MAG: NAD(P)/FAD-dependent oxidoreductase [Verrucomicrobiia bacterium]
MTKTKVAIIAGAGPAGLTAAYEFLKRTDITPIVFEQSGSLGGIAQTYNYKGNRIDLGGHRFFSRSDRVMNWWFNILPPQGAPAADTLEKGHEVKYATEVVQELLGAACLPKGGTATGTRVRRPAPDPEKEDEVMLQRPRLSRIFFRHHFFPYPIGITLTVAKRLGFLNTLLIGLSYCKAQLFPIKDETYLDAFFINRFGRRLYRTFFEKYTEKVWGLPCSRIRADWGAQRVKGLSLQRAVVHAIKDLLSSDFQKAQEQRETSLITRFYYPKYGPGQMWETVSRQIQQCGGEVHLHHRVVGVHLENGRVCRVLVQHSETGQVRQLDCDFFFSTMPIKHLIGMITPTPSVEVVAVAEGLVYRDFLTVGLLLRKMCVQERGKPPASSIPDNWIYIQEPDVMVGRVQIYSNWSPYMAADHKNTTWIGLEYFVNEGDALWVMPDKELVALGIREMEKIGMIKGEDVLDGCVLRMLKAYPAYFGSYPQLSVVRKYVDAIPNLFLVGRNGMHRYNNQDHSMLASMMAVDNILEGRTDKTNLWDINLEMVYHEEKE